MRDELKSWQRTVVSTRRTVLWWPGLLVFCAAGMLLASGCSRAYFRKATRSPPLQAAAVDWSAREYWTGIVFNGSRVGFAHFTMSPVPGEDQMYDIRSEAFLQIRFLWIDKVIHLVSFDRINADLTLQRFHYAYNLDGNRMSIEGQVQNGILAYAVQTRGQIVRRSIALRGSLFPASATGLYPVKYGLQVGSRYRYDVFDGQSQQVEAFDQKIAAYEESDLFSGAAFRVINRFRGQKATTWIDESGYPLLEMSMGGVIIAALEKESTARRLLARAAFNKEDALLAFSRIKSDRIISDPHRVTFMQIRITGVQKSVSIANDVRQNCRRRDAQLICEIDIRDAPAKPIRRAASGTKPDRDLKRYLKPTIAIAARHPRIQQLAAETAPLSASRLQRIRSIVAWQQANIQKEPVDVFTALDVLETGKAECQGHALLFAALARSAEIPTRVVNGIVYVADLQGFLYHSWNECYVDGRWLAIDPTLGQIPADATHVKLVEGHELADLAPLLEIIGRIQIEVIAYQ